MFSCFEPYSNCVIYIYVCVVSPRTHEQTDKPRQSSILSRSIDNDHILRNSKCNTTNTTDTDECASDPCQNGATCNDMVNMYNCTCAPGYEDVFCENGNLSSL